MQQPDQQEPSTPKIPGSDQPEQGVQHKPGSHEKRVQQVRALMAAARELHIDSGAPLDERLIAHSNLPPVRTSEEQLRDLQVSINPSLLEVPVAEQMRDDQSAPPDVHPSYNIEDKRPKDIFGVPYILPSDAVTFDQDGKIETYPPVLMAGRYRLRLEKRIGAGGSGSIFLARVEHDPDLVAFDDLPSLNEHAPEYVIVKLIALKESPDESREQEESVMREISALAKTPAQSPKEEQKTILMLYNAHTYTLGVGGQKIHAIEMAQVEGPSGSEYLKQLEKDPHRFSSERLLEVMVVIRSLLGQLRELAERGVQHRDIKPENIMINQGHVRLTDFGSALALEDTTEQKNLFATALFMSPRLVIKQRDIMADIYSAAVTGLIMLGVATESADLKQASSKGKPSSNQLKQLARDRKIFAMPHLRAANFETVLQEKFPQQYNDKAVREFIFILSLIAQPTSRAELMFNPFGTMEYSRENLLKTIDGALAKIDPLIAQQENNVNRDAIVKTWFRGYRGNELLDHVVQSEPATRSDPDSTRPLQIAA